MAISGGMDSMCLLHLLKAAALQKELIIAHCNFKLRGDESEYDETFIRNYAREQGLQLFVKSFNTAKVAEDQGISIQMAARNLRYEWFYELADNQNCQKIAIAHNQNDNVETFFINLMRGTGISGLSGIELKNSRGVIRPLLFFSREEINTYVRENIVPFREDSSNSTIKYQRNFIRHKILPEIIAHSPGFLETMDSNISRLQSAYNIYDHSIKESLKKLVYSQRDFHKLDYVALNLYPEPETILWEWLKKFGFSPETTAMVYRDLYRQSGKRFYTRTHQLLIDRKFLIVSELENDAERSDRFVIEDFNDFKFLPFSVHYMQVEWKSGNKILPDNKIAYIDQNKITFPLTVRRWEKGDLFYPLGMKGKKKLSDFFIDHKIPISEKEKTYVLVSGNKIVWVIGYRLDDRFKITKDTDEVLILKLDS